MPNRATLNVSLTPGLTAFVAACMASGRYGSASEVARVALRLLERQDDSPPRPTPGTAVETTPCSRPGQPC